MSGYLARLAARAGGAPAAAGPRLPSRFEPSGGGESTGAGVSVAAMDAPERAEARATGHDAARHVAERTDTERTDAERTDAERRATGLRMPGPPRRTGSEPATPETEVPARIPSTRADDDGRLTPLDAGQSATLTAPAVLPRTVTAAPRVEAAPPPRTPAPPATARDEASAAASEPDVVHVTIGRVDVRATIAPTAATPRTPRPPRDAERALHDYLASRTR